MVRARKEKTELEKKLEAELAKGERDRKRDRKQETSPEGQQEVEEGEAAAAEADVSALLAERDELKDLLVRARAEFDNYRKRVARDAEQQRRRAARTLITDLLPVLDHLELALQHAGDNSGSLVEGVELVLKQTMEVLRRHGLELIPAVGEPFDPNVHEAVLQRESADAPPNTVIQEFQRGYRLGDLVLRPTKVVVSAGQPGTGEQEASGLSEVDESTLESGKIADDSE